MHSGCLHADIKHFDTLSTVSMQMEFPSINRIIQPSLILDNNIMKANASENSLFLN